jgi:lipid-binding SYLF domain-containing protein
MRISGRLSILAVLCALPYLVLPVVARAETAEGQQELVDRATLAAQEVLSGKEGHDARALLPRARAVMICPRVFRAGFLFAGEGGGCVLLARGGQGTWSSPAFYSIGSGSVGLQAGVQDAEVMMLILTDNGLRSVLDNQFKVGGNASVALVTIGGGVQGSTTTNLNADIVAFERPRGFFAGFSIEGSVMSADTWGDQVYYNQPVGSVDVVMAMRVNNPAADPLRGVLMRYGSGQSPAAPPALPPPVANGGYDAPPPSGYAAPTGQIQAQDLPPPR